MNEINIGDIQITGNIVATESCKEVSLVIPVGLYNIMIIADDSCGKGRGKILRTELKVYRRGETPFEGSINEEIFGEELVVADSETIHEAMAYCQRKLRRSMYL